MQTVIVIPARFASTRLENKLLLDLGGKSVLEHTYNQACKAKLATKVIIATDDQRIFDHAKSFGAEVYMTSIDHISGTDRIAELANKNPDWEIIINVQGDEPFINPNDIDKAIEPFIHDPLASMVSLYHEISDINEINNPNNVKVVTDANSNALYFSRAAIPFDREKGLGPDVELRPPQDDIYKKHIGLYAYRREILLLLASLPKTKLETREKLEQLRALENGIKIKMLKTINAPIGIDTKEDYERALANLS